MYKNFNITEEERQQILEMHMSHGYKQLISEQDAAPNWDKVKSYLLTNKFPPNYTSKVELDETKDRYIPHVNVYDSQGRVIRFFIDGGVTLNKKAGGRHFHLEDDWTWDGTKPVIQSTDIANPTKASAGFAQNKDDIIKKNKILGVGSKNDTVKMVQIALYNFYEDEINEKKLPNPGCTVDADGWPTCDGIFGQKTKQLVLKFQEDNGLKKDGYVGNETYRFLYSGPFD